MNPFLISCFLVGVASVSLGLFVLLKTTHRQLGKIWFLFSLSVAGYSFGNILLDTTLAPAATRWALIAVYALGIVWIAPLFYHFICTFLDLKRERSILSQYLVGLAFVCILPTGYFFERIDWVFESLYYGIAGKVYPWFLIWWMGLVIYSHYLLISAYHELSLTKKEQIKYFFVATAIGFTGGGLCFLPGFGIALYPWGNFAVFLYPIIMSYAILKHHLMDINVVIRKALIYSFVSAALASVYVGVVTLLTRLLENSLPSSLLYSKSLLLQGLSVGGYMTPFALSGLLAGISSFSLGLFVFLKSPDKKIGGIWFLFALSVAGWGFGGMWMGTSKSAQESMLAERTAYLFGVIWIAPLFYHFVRTYLDLKITKSILTHYLIAAVFLPLLPTLWFFKRADWVWNSLYWPRAGAAEYFFFCWWTGLVIYSHYLLYRTYRAVSATKRNQIKYFFLATAIGFTGGTICYLPNFGIDLYPWGNFAVFLYPIIMSYAMLKHHLMDINVVIKKTLVYSLVSTALAAVYVGTITLVAHMLGGRHGTTSAFSSALAAILITLLFNPVRIKIQRFVDRYFYREAVDQTVLREITSAFVHEIKMPLSNIALPAELTMLDMQDLERGKTSPSDVIPKIKKRMKYIMDQAMLASRRVEAVGEVTGQRKVMRDSIDLAEIVKRSLKQVEAITRRSRTRIRLRLPADLPPVSGDFRQLEIVMVNLLKNAVEAMREQKSRDIGIDAFAEDGHVVLCVKDSGPGINPDEARRIFQPHYSTKGVDGTGMGLYLSRQIIEVHGGTLDASSQNGSGATFTIKLPKAS